MISDTAIESLSRLYPMGFSVTLQILPNSKESDKKQYASDANSPDALHSTISSIPNGEYLDEANVLTPVKPDALPEMIGELITVTEINEPEIEIPIKEPEPETKTSNEISTKKQTKFKNIVNGFNKLAWCNEEGGEITIKKGNTIAKSTWKDIEALSKMEDQQRDWALNDLEQNVNVKSAIKTFVTAVRIGRVEIPTAEPEPDILKPDEYVPKYHNSVVGYDGLHWRDEGNGEVHVYRNKHSCIITWSATRKSLEMLPQDVAKWVRKLENNRNKQVPLRAFFSAVREGKIPIPAETDQLPVEEPSKHVSYVTATKPPAGGWVLNDE